MERDVWRKIGKVAKVTLAASIVLNVSNAITGAEGSYIWTEDEHRYEVQYKNLGCAAQINDYESGGGTHFDVVSAGCISPDGNLTGSIVGYQQGRGIFVDVFTPAGDIDKTVIPLP